MGSNPAVPTIRLTACVAVLLALLLGAAGHAQTPDTIDIDSVVQAVKANPKAYLSYGSYGLAFYARFAGPKQRIADSYRIATKNLRAFDPSLCDTSPLVEVVFGERPGLDQAYEVTHVVIVPKGGEPIQPKKEAPLVRTLTNRLGASWNEQDMVAYFDPADIPAGEFKVVGVFSAGGTPSRTFKAGSRDKIQ